MRRLVMVAAVLAGAILQFSSAAAQVAPYLLRPGDRLEVSVLEDPGLNRTLLVGPDGRISIPLAGVISVAGLPVEAVQRSITQALARDFVSPPSVTVSLVAVGSGDVFGELGLRARVYVIGQVGSPGVYNVALPMDVLQLLAMVGGPGTFAARSRIQVRRRAGDAEVVQLFDYTVVESGAVPSTSIMLTDGDVVVVPERRLFE